ncbi:MAG: cell division protein FtsB [Gammaproteobacteria bacterium]|nr:cell division protein FtsB [Gammaproteobacteria bacterium]
MKWIIALLIGLLLLLQYRLWISDGGIPEVLHLQQEVTTLEQEKSQLEERNNQLGAEVTDLKTGLDAIEERARSEMGMIGKDETFYQIIKTPDTEIQSTPSP